MTGNPCWVALREIRVTTDNANDQDFAALELAARLGADYRREVAAANTFPVASYADILERFDMPVPDQGVDGLTVIEELVAGARDGLRPLAGPRFFGWVNGSSHPAGVAADCKEALFTLGDKPELRYRVAREVRPARTPDHLVLSRRGGA